MSNAILDLRRQLLSGQLYRPPDDTARVEAFIPPIGDENHAPNLAALPNGDLLCVWFAGSREGTCDVSIALSRLPMGEARWTAPVLVSDDPMRSEQNPVLFLAPTGELWLLYTAQDTRGMPRRAWDEKLAIGEVEGAFTMQWTATIRRRISLDGGASWGPVATFLGTPGAFCRQPLVALSNGDWLFPMYYSLEAPGHGLDHSVVRISADLGATWFEVPIPESAGRVQASVIEMDAGRLIALLRSRAADRIYMSSSPDYGRSWSPPSPTILPNNNSSIQACKLASGSIALVYNHTFANDDPTRTVWPKARYPVTIALSEDEGATWPYMRHIDISDGFAGSANAHLNRQCAYPCLLQTRDGMIHVAYSYRGRQCIKYVRFAEEWVREQQGRVWPG